MERIDLAVEGWWRCALVTRVFGGPVCVAASLLQYSKLLLKHAAWLHCNLGRIYGLSIIMLVFPTGVVLAFVAKSGF